MKRIVIISVSLLSIIINTQGFAKGGFSLGVFGSYAVDGGVIENTINDKTYDSTPASKIKSDELIMPGVGLFARYDFSNNLFIRTGAEYNELVSGGKIDNYSSVMDYYIHEIDYKAYVFPVFFGINASPDKGKTNVYAAIGVVMTQIEIRQTKEGFTGGLPYRYESDNSNFVIGFGGLIGIEKRIMQSSYVIIEYSFYNCEMNRDESGKYTFQGNPEPDYEFVEKYGLPRQQIRLGLRYAF
jgi:opacity protein-like surface antigen